MRESVFAAQLKPQQLGQPLCAIAEYVGMEQFIELVDMLGGTNVYFPKRETLLRPFLIDQIVLEYRSGTSCSALARKYHLCERTVRKMVKGR